MDNYTLSVVIPTYNREKLILDTLNSILNQECKDVEIVIVDDGSKDKTKEVLDPYLNKNNNIKYIYKENTGVSDTRNVGIKNSSGKYIAFLDSDDVWYENYFTNDLCNSLKESDTDIYVFSYCMSDMNLNVLEKIEMPVIEVVNNPDKAIDTFYHHFCAFIYKKSLITDNNIYFEPSFTYSEDMLFKTQVLYVAKTIKSQNKIAFYYRENFNSITKLNKNYKKTAQQQLEIYYKIKDFIKEKSGSDEIKNAHTAQDLAMSLKLLSEAGFPYKIIKNVVASENLEGLIKNNDNNVFSLCEEHYNVLCSFNANPLRAYLKHRAYGLFYNNGITIKHKLIKVLKKIK